MGHGAIHPSEGTKRRLQNGRAMFKKVREDRLNTVTTEYVEFGVTPRFYYSKEQLGISFDALAYAVTDELRAKYINESQSINNLVKIEGMLSLYYAQKLIKFLLTDVREAQANKIPKTDAEIALQKSMGPYEKAIVVTSSATAVPKDYDRFVMYILTMINRHKDNLKKYYPTMSEANRKIAISLNLKLKKLHKDIESGDIDILPLYEVSTNKKPVEAPVGLY